MNCCETCLYFRKRRERSGDCRRYPPTIPFGENALQFPAVPFTSWCGEYKPKEEKK